METKTFSIKLAITHSGRAVIDTITCPVSRHILKEFDPPPKFQSRELSTIVCDIDGRVIERIGDLYQKHLLNTLDKIAALILKNYLIFENETYEKLISKKAAIRYVNSLCYNKPYTPQEDWEKIAEQGKKTAQYLNEKKELILFLFEVYFINHLTRQSHE